MHVLNILWVVFGIGLMLVLNLKFKINSMVALLVAALSVGMLAGMDLAPPAARRGNRPPHR